MTDGNEPGPAASSYYGRLPDGRYQPTLHVQGAWNDHEQHMGPVSGLIAHAIAQHEPRPEMLLALMCYEILVFIRVVPTSVTVEIIRAGRTIELVEATLVASAPGTFLMPRESDLRYRWVEARMAALDVEEMRELVLDAWRMVVPKSVARAHDEAQHRPGA